MAEFLISVADEDVPDSPGKMLALSIVCVQEDGVEWTRAERSPAFYRLKVPGVSRADAEHYMHPWEHHPTISIVGSNQLLDGYRLRLESDAVSASGKHAFSRPQIENYFTGWNAEVVDWQQNAVVFDITVYGAITSERFWDTDLAGVVFAETNYDQATGDHTVQIQQSPYTQQQMVNRIRLRKGTIVPPDSFIMNRSVARDALMEDIVTRIMDIPCEPRKWFITAAGAAALQAAGGELTITPAQFINNIRSAMDD